MREKSRQIKFYVSESDFQELQQLKVRKNMTLQDLMNDAVSYLRCDLDYLQDIERDQALERDLERGVITTKSERFYLRLGERSKVQTWLSCLRMLPEESSGALLTLMNECLRYFNSSRLKPRRAASEGATDEQKTPER